MSLGFDMGQQVSLMRRTPKPGAARYDAYGNVAWDVAVQIVPGCAIYPTSLTENDQGQERTTSFYTCVLPAHVQVNNVDYVLWDGRRYEVADEPAQYRNPFTGASLQTVQLKRIEG